MSRPHYFDMDEAPSDDVPLRIAKGRGYVPDGCLLGGQLVMAMVREGKDPCVGCEGPREKCGGRPRDRSEGEDGATFSHMEAKR